MRRIRSLPNFLRPREKLINQGPSSLSLVELLCVILNTGTKTHPVHIIASRVAKLLNKSEDITIASLKALGVGQSKAAQLIAVIEIAKRNQNSKPVALTSPDHIYAHAYEILNEDKEIMLCFYLNARGELLKKERLAVGSLNKVNLLPCEIFHLVKQLPVASIILVHNHPSGSIEPSKQDILFTQRVKRAADILGITLLDHLIVTKDGWKQIPLSDSADSS